MAEANWYVVHTYSGYENKVKANIDKTIENRHLEDQILEVRVPLEEVTEVKNGVKKQVSKKMFPGYVLIHMIMNDDTWYVVRNTRGVTGFVGPGNRRRAAGLHLHGQKRPRVGGKDARKLLYLAGHRVSRVDGRSAPI